MPDKPRPRRFDLIAFDWDGTLFDSTGLIVRCIQSACRDIGTPVPDDMQAAYVIGLGLMDALKHAVPDLPVERYPELGRRYRHHYMAWQHEIVLFDGTRDMLQTLKARNHWLAVATGKSRHGLNEALASAQLGPLFDSTRTADETASKPDPLMLLELMAELGAEPSRTLMVGDTGADIGGARLAVAPRCGQGDGLGLPQPLGGLGQQQPGLREPLIGHIAVRVVTVATRLGRGTAGRRLGQPHEALQRLFSRRVGRRHERRVTCCTVTAMESPRFRQTSPVKFPTPAKRSLKLNGISSTT